MKRPGSYVPLWTSTRLRCLRAGLSMREYRALDCLCCQTGFDTSEGWLGSVDELAEFWEWATGKVIYHGALRASLEGLRDKGLIGFEAAGRRRTRYWLEQEGTDEDINPTENVGWSRRNPSAVADEKRRDSEAPESIPTENVGLSRRKTSVYSDGKRRVNSADGKRREECTEVPGFPKHENEPNSEYYRRVRLELTNDIKDTTGSTCARAQANPFRTPLETPCPKGFPKGSNSQLSDSTAATPSPGSGSGAAISGLNISAADEALLAASPGVVAQHQCLLLDEHPDWSTAELRAEAARRALEQLEREVEA